MFSFGLPILYLIIAAFFWLGHWVDRYTLLRRISPRVATYDRMMDWVLRKVLPLSIALHVMMAFVFFNDICVTTGERIETTQSTQFMCERLVLGGGHCFRQEDACDDDDQRTIFGMNTTAFSPCSYQESLLAGTVERSDLEAIAGGTLEHNHIALNCYMPEANETTGLWPDGMQPVCMSAMLHDCSTEWTPSYTLILVSMVIWLPITLMFMVTNTKWYTERAESIRILRGGRSSWVLDLWRFLVQRDVREKAVHAKPRNAHVRAASPENADAAEASMSGAGGSRKPRLSKRKQLARLTLSNSGKERKKDKRGLLRESSLEDTSRFVLLSDDSPMYLPPLTTALLTMYCESAQVSNKMMDSYLEQHVQAPLRQRAPTVVVGRDSVVDGSDGGGGRRQSLAAGPQWSACGGGVTRTRGTSDGGLLSGLLSGTAAFSAVQRPSQRERRWDEGVKIDALADSFNGSSWRLSSP